MIVQVKENRSENATLKAQISELKSENNELQAALSRKIPCQCDKCQLTREIEELRRENAEGMTEVQYMFNFMLYQLYFSHIICSNIL